MTALKIDSRAVVVKVVVAVVDSVLVARFEDMPPMIEEAALRIEAIGAIVDVVVVSLVEAAISEEAPPRSEVAALSTDSMGTTVTVLTKMPFPPPVAVSVVKAVTVVVLVLPVLTCDVLFPSSVEVTVVKAKTVVVLPVLTSEVSFVSLVEVTVVKAVTIVVLPVVTVEVVFAKNGVGTLKTEEMSEMGTPVTTEASGEMVSRVRVCVSKVRVTRGAPADPLEL